MDIKSRSLTQSIKEDLNKHKMVFIGGPRQVGKTTLSELIGEKFFTKTEYLNWDNRDNRRAILGESFMADSDLIIFDELHKLKSWKNYLKGIYDRHKNDFSIILTGSARLDIYRKGGDSLLGRYHYYRLHPFSLAELIGINVLIKPFDKLSFQPQSKQSREFFESLFKFGGFPDPLFEGSEKNLRRWHNERIDRLIKEDIRDIELVRDISSLQILVELLEAKAASQLSLNSLCEDLRVTHKTVSLWVDILEKFYFHFRIYPFSFSTIKSLRKEPKIYLWDWSSILDEGKKFENLIASHLLKFVHFLHDVEGYKAELYYLRDVAGREVDFLVTVDKKPWFAVEAKLSDRTPSGHLNYFGARLKIPYLFQVIAPPGINILEKNVNIISAEKFLSGLL